MAWWRGCAGWASRPKRRRARTGPDRTSRRPASRCRPPTRSSPAVASCSAARRPAASDYVLQHGSLPLTGDLTRLVDCLALPSEDERDALRRALAERAATVQDITGCLVSIDEAASALAAGFSEALGLEFVVAELTAVEQARVDELVRDRYQNAEWTAHR